MRGANGLQGERREVEAKGSNGNSASEAGRRAGLGGAKRRGRLGSAKPRGDHHGKAKQTEAERSARKQGETRKSEANQSEEGRGEGEELTCD